MKLDILILTMPTRVVFLNRLLACLNPQCEGRSDVGILIRVCDPSYTLGENRDMLRRSSKAEYSVYCDDDDLPSTDYISTILPLLNGVDYIGYQVQCYVDGVALSRTYHSLKYSGWSEDDKAFYRDISHINPMRRELALLETFEGGHGEDQRWADRMRKRGVLKTEHFIDRVMYSYFFRTRKNAGAACPKCTSSSTVIVENGTFCNSRGILFDEVSVPRKSCLWA